jgi:PTS system mannose-specific IIB component
MSFELIRIDDRMIHGQIVMTWIRYTRAQAVYLIDDKVAQDETLKKIMIMIAPTDVEVRILSIKEAMEEFQDWKESEKKYIIIIRTPQTLIDLLELGANISEVNIGGIGSGPGKKKLYRNISISEEERSAIKQMLEQGIDVNIQTVPSERKHVLTIDSL